MLTPVRLSGLAPRQSELARGIVVVRSRRTLTPDEQRALLELMAAGGITDPPSDARVVVEDRMLVAAPWAPPTEDQLEVQRAAAMGLSEVFDVDAVWFVAIETSINGIGWAEEQRARALANDEDEDEEFSNDENDDDDSDDENDDDEDDDSDDENDADDDDDDENDDADAGDSLTSLGHRVDVGPTGARRLIAPRGEVLYVAADPAAVAAVAAADLDNDDVVELGSDEDEDIFEESLWRGGAPPREHGVDFPLQRYPEILRDYDWEDFGIALKLAGPLQPGEDSVVNAFFALWLSVYQDERTSEFEPFHEADVLHDREHRSALLWVEQFDVPATAADQVHFLLWIVSRLSEVVPIAWARFDQGDLSAKSGWDDQQAMLVLAGNPLAERLRRGEDQAMEWAISQSLWSHRELAAMLVELAVGYDPDEVASAAIAERLLERASQLDPTSEASGLRATVWIRQGQFTRALELAASMPRPALRVHVLTELLAHAPTHIDDGLALISADTLVHIDDASLGELVAAFAENAATKLGEFLALLPARSSLVPHLYNASFEAPRAAALAMLRRVLELPVPPVVELDDDDNPDEAQSVVVENHDNDDDELAELTLDRQLAARKAYVMSWNNACIHAHALGDFALAAELATGAQPYAVENPYIFHSAACAYVGNHQPELARQQVALAIQHGYPHAEAMETDSDLGTLVDDPQFLQLFRDWRADRTDLN